MKVPGVECPIILPKWHPKQLYAYNSPAQEILFAGDTRAGKSFFVRKSYIYYCSQIPGLLCDIFRVNFDDVIRNYMEGETSFPILLAEWEKHGLCKINQTEIIFWNESRISLEHCFSGDTKIQTTEGLIPISELAGRHGYVSIGSIITPFRSVRKTRESAALLELTFDDGQTYKCTPDHRFITAVGLVEARHLLGAQCLTNQCSLSAIRSRYFERSATPFRADTSVMGRNDYTKLFGSITKELSQAGLKSIIEMGIESITKSKIWRYWKYQLIDPCMLQRLQPKLAAERILRKLVPQPAYGTAVRPAGYGINSRLLESKRIESKSSARYAAPSIQDSPIIGSAAGVAKLPIIEEYKRCVRIEPCRNEDVYCLSVPEFGFFPLSNGVLALNCADDKVMQKHQGVSRHVRTLDESAQIPETRIRALSGWVTMSNEMMSRVPEYWRGQFPKLFHITNPVGVSSNYYRKYFVEARDPYSIEKVGQFTRQYIPAFVEDNPSEDQDNTRARIAEAFTNKGIQDALIAKDRSGITNWRQKVGVFFSNLDYEKHVIHPFKIPDHWPRFMSMDWGACGDGDPFSIGWYTIADGTVPVTSYYGGTEMPCQRESLICYRRWNGRGLPKVTAAQVADGILGRESGEPILFRIAGGDIIEARGHGESIFTIFQERGVRFMKADNRRINGWAQVDYRLEGENDFPLSFWFQEAEGDLETMGSLQHDKNNPQDIAKGDDHDCVIGETLVDTEFGPVPIRGLVGTSGNVFTKAGILAEYRDCRLYHRDREVWRVRFRDGREVIGTPDHRFLTHFGWKELRELRPNDKIISVILAKDSYEQSRDNQRDISRFLRKKILSLRPLFQFAKKGAEGVVSFASSRLGTSQWAHSKGHACASSGWGCREQSDRKFGAFTGRGTFISAHENAGGPAKVELLCQEAQQGDARKGKSLEENRRGPSVAQGKLKETLEKHAKSNTFLSFLWKGIRDFCKSAACFPVLSPKLQNEGTYATVSEVTPHGVADVYCLTVPDFGAFSVNRGIIIANCDRHRYAAMTRPIARDQKVKESEDHRDRNQTATPDKLIARITRKDRVAGYTTRR